MSKEKTCGTCEHCLRDYAEDSNGYVGGACHVSLMGGKYRFVYCEDSCSESRGKAYTPRQEPKSLHSKSVLDTVNKGGKQ